MPTPDAPPTRVDREDWETRLKARPTVERVLALMAYEGAHACRERWGDYPAHLIRKAKRPPRGLRSS
jgi:hypothetical protein